MSLQWGLRSTFETRNSISVERSNPLVAQSTLCFPTARSGLASTRHFSHQPWLAIHLGFEKLGDCRLGSGED